MSCVRYDNDEIMAAACLAVSLITFDARLLRLISSNLGLISEERVTYQLRAIACVESYPDVVSSR